MFEQDNHKVFLVKTALYQQVHLYLLCLYSFNLYESSFVTKNTSGLNDITFLLKIHEIVEQDNQIGIKICFVALGISDAVQFSCKNIFFLFNCNNII